MKGGQSPHALERIELDKRSAEILQSCRQERAEQESRFAGALLFQTEICAMRKAAWQDRGAALGSALVRNAENMPRGLFSDSSSKLHAVRPDRSLEDACEYLHSARALNFCLMISSERNTSLTA